MSAASPRTQQRFLPHGPFHAELQRRVNAHFAQQGGVKTGGAAMFLKTAIILSWFAGSWALLTFWASDPISALLLSLSLGLAMAGIGFNIQHDGNHGGYSRNRFLNRAMAATLDVLGGSSYIWSWKHNVFHHSNPNVDGLDADIEVKPMARLAPTQPRYAVHRFQHFYIWVLYSFLAIKWHVLDDFVNMAIGKIGENNFPRPKPWGLVGFFAGKVLFFTWSLVIPLMLHPWWHVAIFYAITSATLALTLAIVFQLAHVVQEAEFPATHAPEGATMEWSAHQLATTVDFAPGNPFLTWYLGGLNYQIEHHLFPRICHTRYPEIAPIVEQTAKEFGVPYQVHPTFFTALASHYRHVRRMGMQPAEGPQAVSA